ncbi:hypothetical protein ACJJTC_004384 [Scirpophaga incertulas]
MEKEEGEMSDDNIMLVDYDTTQDVSLPKENSALTYRAVREGLIIQELEKVDCAKLEDRAKRFGLNLSGSMVVTQERIDNLYANCGIKSESERHFRFDTIHLSGVDGLSTREIFEYLEDYKPVSLEWIDDVSCNIVCSDHIVAALVLLVHSREIIQDDIKKMISERSNHYWREGMPHYKKDLILMRFATNADKKMNKKRSERKHTMDVYIEPNKNPWGDLCKSWGVYDNQEIYHRKLVYDDDDDDEYYEENREDHVKLKIKNKNLAMRLGKRGHNHDENEEDSSSDSEWKKKLKVPRMRMHADDEESKQKKIQQDSLRNSSNDTDVYAPLSIEVVNSTSHYIPKEITRLSDKFKNRDTAVQKPNVQSRLGSKVLPPNDIFSSDDSSVNSIDYNVMSRVQKINTISELNNTSSVWSRLQTNNDELEHGSDLRHILKSKRHKHDDLRERIGKSKQSKLRIEIDNSYAKR